MKEFIQVINHFNVKYARNVLEHHPNSQYMKEFTQVKDLFSVRFATSPLNHQVIKVDMKEFIQHSEHATLMVLLIGTDRPRSIVSACSNDWFLCQ